MSTDSDISFSSQSHENGLQVSISRGDLTLDLGLVTSAELASSGGTESILASIAERVFDVRQGNSYREDFRPSADIAKTLVSGSCSKILTTFGYNPSQV